SRPSHDQLFQSSPGVELNQALAQRKPLVCRLLDDFLGHVDSQDDRTALVRKLSGLSFRVLLDRAKVKWACLQIHGEAIVPRLPTRFEVARVGSLSDDLLRTKPGCTMQQHHDDKPGLDPCSLPPAR